MSGAALRGWDPELLARLGRLQLIARQATDRAFGGTHTSLRTASNVEFADYKEYTPGDALRDLDWKVYGRSDRLVVRRHRAESDLPVLIVLDASADLGTGTSGRPPLEGHKAGAAIVLAASLAVGLVRRGEPVGLEVWGGREMDTRSWPARRGEAHLAGLLGTLARVVPDGRGHLDRGFTELVRRLPKRTVVMVVSDFMEAPATWANAMRGLRATHTDLRVVQVYDRRELALDFDAHAQFFSPEDPSVALPVDSVVAREAFAGELARYLAELRTAIAAADGFLVRHATDQRLDATVRALLERA